MRRWRSRIVPAMIVAAWLAIGRPWTIRPIGAVSSGPFDAHAYVAEMWEARALPAFTAKAVPFTAFAHTHTSSATPVSASGVVLDVDTTSRVGIARVATTPGGHADLRLLVGPVLRGTALRDALDFVQFTDFTNQIQFASVADALNDRVLSTALKDVSPLSLPGRRVEILGVAWRDPGAPDALPLVIPVRLTVGDRP
jgi:predicted lipoprotein